MIRYIASGVENREQFGTNRVDEMKPLTSWLTVAAVEHVNVCNSTLKTHDTEDHKC